MVSPVVTTTIDSNIGYVRELMERKKVSSIPIIVMDGEHILPVGIVTTSDLKGITDEGLAVEGLMTRGIHTISKNRPAIEAAQKMITKNIHHLLVMEEGNIIGMLSSFDFVNLAAKLLEKNGESYRYIS